MRDGTHFFTIDAPMLPAKGDVAAKKVSLTKELASAVNEARAKPGDMYRQSNYWHVVTRGVTRDVAGFRGFVCKRTQLYPPRSVSWLFNVLCCGICDFSVRTCRRAGERSSGCEVVNKAFPQKLTTEVYLDYGSRQAPHDSSYFPSKVAWHKRNS